MNEPTKADFAKAVKLQSLQPGEPRNGGGSLRDFVTALSVVHSPGYEPTIQLPLSIFIGNAESRPC